MRAIKVVALALAAAVVATACEKAQLLAPTRSTISVSAPTRLLPTNGSTEITAVVIEEAGTPVQNGTTVRFTTSLGRVDPVEVQTRNGIAITTFLAGNTSGVARISATSGGASGGDEDANVVEITIGNAAVKAVSVRANPGSVSPNGSTVDLIATVVATDGGALPGVLVTFNANQGTLGSSTALTNAAGEARTTLTTNQSTTVSATAGLVTSSDITITARAGPALTITCAPASGGGTNCAAVAANASNQATVVFTITRPSGSSSFRTATIDFGDGTSQSLGTLAGGSTTVTHTYAGPASQGSHAYTATVQATDINNESVSASTSVIVVRNQTPISVTITDSCPAATSNQGQRCTFTANVSGGGDGGTGNAAVESYRWNFGDGSAEVTTSGNSTSHVYTADGTYEVTVTIETPDGRSATGRTEVLINVP